MSLFHYTDFAGYNAIASQVIWTFRASKPRGPHPVGAYFTTLGPTTRNLAKRLRIPRSKVDYSFAFTDVGDLTPIAGGRGSYIRYAPTD